MSATIYKIYCRNSEIKECYVGSTEEFTERCRKHKSICNNTNDKDHNLKVYKFIRANGGFDNFIIEQIIDCEIEDRYDCELYYFKLFNATLNSQFPKRSRKEYRIDNKEKISEYQKEWRGDNNEYLKEYFKQYRIHNKEKIKEQKKIKIECECGSVVRKSDISKHIKSTKHQNYINSKL
jgi:hypothetical protein